jgi:uncharacterized protein (DUF2225 family)
MTTFGETTYECPICGEGVPAMVLHSTNQMGQDTDFCPVTMGFHAVPLVIHACENCGYAGYDEEFQEREFPPEERVRFLDANVAEGLLPLEARLDNLDADHRYYLAYLTRRHFGGTAEELADFLLRASWCLRLEGGRPRDDTAASRYRREAMREYALANDKAGEGEDRRRTFLYLVAELRRREGEFDARPRRGRFQLHLRGDPQGRGAVQIGVMTAVPFSPVQP